MNQAQLRAEKPAEIQSQDLEKSFAARTPPERATVDDEVEAARRRYERIAEAAYRRAEQRGFASGGEIADWLAAEREFDAAGASPND